MSRELATLITIGKRAFKEKDFSRAEKLLREAIDGGADYADIHYILGLIYHQEGKLGPGIEHFERALGLNPQYTEALLSLSITLNDMGRYEEAKDAYRRASESVERAEDSAKGNMFRGKIANLHAELGELYLALRQYENAIGEYRKALTVAPGYPDLRIRMAVALREAGRPEESMEEIRKVLSSHPGSIEGMIQRGILLYLTGMKEDARKAWEEALYRDPTNRLIQLYLNTLDREIATP